MAVKRGKKAQLTIFIVTGLVILIIALLLFYVVSQSRREFPEKEGSKEKPYAAGQTELRQYVEACIRPAVLQGIQIIGLQGGYINLPDDVGTMRVKDTLHNYQVRIIDGNKKVVVAEGEGNEVPYWVLRDSLAIPTLSFIEGELEQYVTEELEKCVNDFKPFRDENYEVNYSSISTDVEMEKAVVVNIKFPIEMRRGDITFKEEEFFYTVPINMRLLYEMAYDLAAFESVYGYLEDHTKSLISLYSAIDRERLPPFSQSDTSLGSCKSVEWEKSEVEGMLKGIFSMNVPHLKIKGTTFTLPEVTDPIARGVYESFVYDFFESDFPTLEVSYSYRPEWDFMIYDVEPSRGSTLKPHKFKQNKIPLLPLVCVMDYDFKYTIDYPVLVQIKDAASARIDPESNTYFEGEGFTFQFLLDSFICGNEKRRCTGRASVEVSPADSSVDVSALPESLFCDEEQRISGNILIRTIDKGTNTPLEGVDVYYWCGSYENDCFMGTTDSRGVLEAKFPQCINGVVYFLKDNYVAGSTILTTRTNEAKTIRHELSPMHKLDAKVMKYKMPQPNQLGQLMPLEPEDQLILTVQRKDSRAFDTSVQRLTFDSNTQKGEINLAEGEYEISGTLITNGFTIPADCYKFCVHYDWLGDCDDYDTKPDQPINDLADQATLGGIKIGASNSYWHVSESELNQAREVTFYIIQVPTPTCIDDATDDDESCLIGTCISIAEIGKTEDYTTMFRPQLEPKFS
jgi:hypothetical protein